MRIINILEEFIDDFLIWESVLGAELDKACVEVPFSLLSLARSDLISQGFVVLVHLGQGLVPLFELCLKGVNAFVHNPFGKLCGGGPIEIGHLPQLIQHGRLSLLLGLLLCLLPLLLLGIPLLLNLLGILLQLLLLLGTLRIPVLPFVSECLGFFGVFGLDLGGPCATPCRFSSSLGGYVRATTVIDGGINAKFVCHVLTLRRVVPESGVVCSSADEYRVRYSEPVFSAETDSQAVWMSIKMGAGRCQV